MIRGGGFEKYCEVCGGVFIAVNNSQKYCNAADCKKKVKRAREKIYYYATKNNESGKRYRGRYSGRSYVNTPERLEEIKNKYKNGVTLEHLKAMFEGGINEQIQSI